uniref:Uncharacterized protein n=1 Tax=Arundo donax TaxID=35708 RepID=A0A0A8YNN7_ARUDO
MHARIASLVRIGTWKAGSVQFFFFHLDLFSSCLPLWLGFSGRVSM